MNRTLRFILIGVGVLIVLLIVIPFFIPVNQFKPTIEEKASAALGRKVQLGNLSLSLIHGALTAEDLSIGDDPKFSPSPFLTAKSLSVGVEIMPLIFSKQLNVTDIEINEPQVTLLKDAKGTWNYSTMGATSSDAAKTEAKTSGGATPDISVKKLELKKGKITVGSTTSQKRNTYDNVNVTASDFSLNSKFPVTVSADLPGGGSLKLDGNVGPVDKTDSTLTPVDAKLHVSSLNLASTGILDPSLGLGGIADVDTTLANAGGFAQTNGTIKLSKALFVQGGSPAGVPLNVDYSTKYDLRKNSGVLNPSTVKIGGATAHLSGTYGAEHDETVVDMKVTAEGMPAKDLEAFLPAIGVHLPTGASLTAGTLNTNLNIKGPTNKLVTDGTIGLFSGTLSGFDLGSKMSAVTALTGLKTGKDLAIEKLTTNLHMAPNGLKAENFIAVLPSLGNVTGAGTLDSKNNLDFKMAATLTGGAIGAMGGSGAGVGSLVGALGGSKGSSCKGGTTIPFVIQGTASDPKFVPDVGGVAAGMLKSQLGCAGGSLTNVGKTGDQAPADAVKSLGGLFGKKKNP
ncbi:MAG TPA: AsmA family protein [Candidatus Acidoferrum sp.]|jgi:AsmA protein